MRIRIAAVMVGPVAWMLAATAVVFGTPLMPPLQPVSDSRGMFTISFPVTWHIESQELRRSSNPGQPPDEGFVSIVSGVATDRRTRLTCFGKILKKPLTAHALADASPLEPQTDEILTLVQKGPTRIDGWTAYYEYHHVDSPKGGVGAYDVVVHVAAGRAAFTLWGMTTRDDAHMRDSLPLVLQLIETFHVRKVPGVLKASLGFPVFP